MGAGSGTESVAKRSFRMNGTPTSDGSRMLTQNSRNAALNADDELFKRIIRATRGPSVGGPPSGAFLDMDDDEWYGAYDTLVMSAVWTTRFAYPHLRDSEYGSVVAITSRSVREVIDDLVLSNAVRRAVIGLVKTQAREFAPDVRVNAVLPGAHETARIEELIEDAVERGDYDSYEEGLADKGSDVPLGRIGDPQELGDVVAFLSSPRASYVTGTALPIDGGSTRS